MPTERRQIILSRDELFDAIDSYRRMNPGALPAGDILNFDLVGDAGLEVVVAATFGKSTTEINVELDERQVLELLVRFCSENNIELPARGTKAGRIVGQRIALAMEVPH